LLTFVIVTGKRSRTTRTKRQRVDEVDLLDDAASAVFTKGAIDAINRVKAKLLGIERRVGENEGTTPGTKRQQLSVPDQVDELIKVATDPEQLAAMYLGWSPFF
jgi:hypothetical protein